MVHMVHMMHVPMEIVLISSLYSSFMSRISIRFIELYQHALIFFTMKVHVISGNTTAITEQNISHFNKENMMTVKTMPLLLLMVIMIMITNVRHYYSD